MSDDTLMEALKGARTRETARLEALFRLNDVGALRLMALRDLMLPELAGKPESLALFDLSFEGDDGPRLWIDLSTSIVMEPNPKTYSLIRVEPTGRKVLFETTDAEAMKRVALRHAAHGLYLQRANTHGAGAIAWQKKPSLVALAAVVAGVGLGVVGTLVGLKLLALRFFT